MALTDPQKTKIKWVVGITILLSPTVLLTGGFLEWAREKGKSEKKPGLVKLAYTIYGMTARTTLEFETMTDYINLVESDPNKFTDPELHLLKVERIQSCWDSSDEALGEAKIARQQQAIQWCDDWLREYSGQFPEMEDRINKLKFKFGGR